MASRENTCCFCGKGIRTSSQVMICLHIDGGDDFLLEYKHRDCGPIKQCAYPRCKAEMPFNDEHGELEWDVSIGQSEGAKRLVLVNYCSRSCRKRDDYYLDGEWDDIQEATLPHVVKLFDRSVTVRY